jgi:hypothetical protein
LSVADRLKLKALVGSPDMAEGFWLIALQNDEVFMDQASFLVWEDQALNEIAMVPEELASTSVFFGNVPVVLIYVTHASCSHSHS